MTDGLIATLIAVRDAILAGLPLNSAEILRQIPHPVPGYRDDRGGWHKSASASTPDDKKMLSEAIMKINYDTSKTLPLRAALTPSFLTDLKLCVVSLKKLYVPVMGKIDEEENVAGASTAKIAGLYALFQLLYEMTRLVVDKSLILIEALQTEANAIWASKGFVNNDSGTRLPNLKRLFKFYLFATPTVRIFRATDADIVDYFDLFDPVSAAPKLFFSPAILEILWPSPTPPRPGHAAGFSRENVGGLLFKHLGFAYVGSIMLQSGLFTPDGPPSSRSGKGIWVRSDYHIGGDWPAAENPFPTLRSIQNITAKSVADFFTLLMQKRLVNAKASNEMQNILGRGGCLCSFNYAGKMVLASKCGRGSDDNRIFNDAVVLRDPDVPDYIVVALTRTLATKKYLENNQGDFLLRIKNTMSSI